MPVTLAELVDLVAQASVWAYLVLALVALLDALLPIVPSETAVITAGVVAATGELRLSLVVLVAAAGASLGDNLTYALGRRWGGMGQRVSSRRVGRRLDWAKAQLDHRGGELIVVGRFIPGGRTAVNLSAGSLGYSWPRFASYDVAAACLWAFYAAGLGFFGGEAFKDAPWKGLLVALVLAAAVAGAREAVRVWRRSSERPPPSPRSATDPDLPAVTDVVAPTSAATAGRTTFPKGTRRGRSPARARRDSRSYRHPHPARPAHRLKGLAMTDLLTQPTTRREPQSATTASRRVLVVVDDACTAPHLCASIRAFAAGKPIEAQVVAPAHGAAVAQWYVDEDAARAEATHRLRTCLSCLSQDGIHVSGYLGDADPVLAIADALYAFDADEILLVTGREQSSRWLRPSVLERVGRTFTKPIRHVVMPPDEARR